MSRSSIFLMTLGTLFFVSPLQAAPDTQEYSDYYDIQGTSAVGLREHMNAQRPTAGKGDLDAYTEWKIKWHFDYQPQGQACALTQSRVALDIIYLLPRWTNENDADSALQTHWEKYLRSLHLHETGHANNGRAAAEEIADMLQDLAPMSTCPLLEEMANQRAQQIIREHNTWDRQYDQETRHGATQGAVFP